MCKSNVPSVTLQTAVLMQVKEFANNNQQFSVHEVTRGIRSKVSQGDIEIPEVEVAGASFRFDIPHYKVKGIFEELWRTGVFDPTCTLSRNFNGTYFEYIPSNQASPVTTANVAVQQLNANPSHASAPLQNTKSDISDRIEKYLTNCANRNYRPTIKQIQSAIKRGDASTGWTSVQIKSIVEDDLGYSVIDDPDYVSASQVQTV